MKEKILKNKFVFILLIFLILITIYSNTFAYSNINLHCNFCDVILTLNFPNEVTIPETSLYKDVTKHNITATLYYINDTYYLVCGNSYDESLHQSSVAYLDSQGRYYMSPTPYNFNWYVYDKTSKTWSMSGWCGGGYNNGNTSLMTSFIKEGTIISSSSNIYTDSSCSEIFFQNPPQVEITTIAQVEELPKIMNKVLQVIIPIGLVVLSIGLLIYVVKSVILRKI